jgi:hypothetical protein
VQQEQQKQQEEERLDLEPMLDYKYPNIASGLIPLGALSAHPIEDEIINNGDEEGLMYKL